MEKKNDCKQVKIEHTTVRLDESNAIRNVLKEDREKLLNRLAEIYQESKKDIH